MNEFDIPIFKKSYDLYKNLHEHHRVVPKKDRFTVYEHAENALLRALSGIFKASTQPKREKVSTLNDVSSDINLFRIFVRLMKDVKAIDNVKYTKMQSEVEEIGRMLGGWIRSLKAD